LKKQIRYWNVKLFNIFFLVILATSVFLVITLFFTINISNQFAKSQKDIFDQTVETVRRNVENNQKDSLDSIRLNGYTIVITNPSDEIVYPTENSKSSFREESSFRDAFTQKFSVGTLHVVVSKPIYFSTINVKRIIFAAIPPTVCSVLIIVAVEISFYTYIYLREKKKMANFFNAVNEGIAVSELENKNFNIYFDDYEEIEGYVRNLYKNLRDTQKKMEKEMKTVQRLESEKNTLFRGVTHEMKTPLMAIKLLNHDLQQTDLTERQSEKLVKISHQISLLEQLVHDILFILQKKDQEHASVISVRSELDNVLQNYDVLLEDKNITVVIEQKADFFLKLDEIVMGKLLSNLISNAVRYSPKNSKIKVNIEDTYISIQNKVAFADKINLETITMPFVSFGQESGSGLGLYLVEMMLSGTKYKLLFHYEQGENFSVKIMK
jgi:signal transduction histidine kinase